MWAADLSRLIDHGVEVWTHTLHPVSGFSQGLPTARAAVRQPGEKSEFGRLRFVSCTAVFFCRRTALQTICMIKRCMALAGSTKPGKNAEEEISENGGDIV